MDLQATDIQEGMTVLDSTGDKIGTVKAIQFSDENPHKPGPETTSVNRDDYTDDSLFHDLVEAFTGTVDIPEELAARLMRAGYVQIDTGLLQSDAYAMLSQISHTTDDEVHLNAEASQVIRA